VPLKKLSAEELQDLRQEVAILSSIYHPNVVLFMGACTKEEEQLMIVTDLKDCTVESLLKKERERRKALEEGGGANGGRRGTYITAPSVTSSPVKGSTFGSSTSSSSSSLLPGSPSHHHHLHGHVGSSSVSLAPTFMSSPIMRMRMARDTALGTAWLHNISHIIHRDLKSANLLFDEASGRVCVTDFGLSQALAPDAKAKDRFGPRGSALFMAPEVIKELEFDHRVDTYSFGIILWELWTCEEPFSEFYDFDTFVDAVHVRGMRPPISSQNFASLSSAPDAPGSSSSSSSTTSQDLKKSCHPKLVDLIKSCWSESPSKRPLDFETILHSLDEIIVDLALGNGAWPKASQFWFDSFCKDDLVEKVSWNEFLFALEQHTDLRERKKKATSGGSGSSFGGFGDSSSSSFSSFGESSTFGLSSSLSSPSSVPINQLGFELLAPFLLSADGKSVTLTQFADVVEWFGHWYDPDLVLLTLAQIHDIVNAEWFAGAITRQQAEAHINSKQTCPHGDSFLVRLSASFPGCPFTITRPSYATRRPNLRVKRVPNPSSSASSSSFNFSSSSSSSSPFLYMVDYGSDGASRSFATLPELIEGLKSELRLNYAAPPIGSSSGGY
jgi:serine/threonine protein kinase